MDIFRSKEKNRNRYETRIARVYKGVGFSSIDWFKWDLVDAIIELKRKRKVFNTKKKKWETSDEKSYYISTIGGLGGKSYNRIIRNHWGIENRNHYVRDGSLGEDDSRIRCKPFNMAALKSFALNILRYNNVTNIKSERYRNSLNSGRIMSYKGISEN